MSILSMNRIFPALVIIFLWFSPAFSSTGDSQSRMLISLLDYIGKDYSKAVVNGEVISEFEFDEMNEFSENTVRYFSAVCRQISIPDSLAISTSLTDLQALIANKKSSGDVYKKANEIKKRLLSLNLISISPEKWPDLSQGKVLFLKHCATCHGEKGDAKNTTFVGLNPVPASFLDTAVVNKLSPFQSFNTVRLGLPGTAMRAFDELSDEEVWDLSFYINSLRFSEEEGLTTGKNMSDIPLSDVSALNDAELSKKFPDLKPLDLASLRSYQVSSEVESPLDIARRHLNEALAAYEKGDVDLASDKALKAYLEGIEPIERIIMASDAELVGSVEKKMMKVRSEIKAGESMQVISASIEEARLELINVENLLNSQQHTLGFAVFMSASILVREGLEAFLIIIAILGILRSLNANRPIYYIHGGWITAIAVGVASWFFADWLMQWNVQSRELMEGLIALFAVFVLLYIGFWLHNKTEISKWKKFVEDKIKVLVHKDNMFGLAFFAFIVVFREVFESVIFLSSLSVEVGEENQSGILIGVILASLLVFLLSWAILKIFDKVPLRKVFLYSSAVIIVLAVILAGEGIHAIQESGLISVTSSPVNVRIPFIGLYPTYETWLAQFATMLVIFVLWFFSRPKIKA